MFSCPSETISGFGPSTFRVVSVEVVRAMEEKSERMFLPLFDGTNYSAWKFRMEILLEEHELQECIQTLASEVESLQDVVGDSQDVKKHKEVEREKRAKLDRKCKSLLVSRIHDSQLEYIQDKQYPKDIWDALRRVFERRSIASRMHLKRRMLTLRFEHGRLQDHFLQFDKLVREYRSTGADLDELDVVCHLLLTLGSSYSAVVTALETMPEENLSLEFVKCRLLDEETKRKGVELGATNNDGTAFAGSKQPQRRTKIKCFGCKKEGHILSECTLKKKKKSGGDAKSKAHMAGDGGVCFVGVSRGEKVRDESSPIRWYIDSGCSDHLVNDKALFEDLKPLRDPIEIAIAKDGESIVAKCSGTVKVISCVGGKRTECTVENVLYVPELRCNLFSVMRIDEAGMRVVYEGGKVKIYHQSKIVASGTRVGKLYQLDFWKAGRSKSESLLSCGRIPKDLELWHRRYGHLNAKSLEQLFRCEMVTGVKCPVGANDNNIIVCEPCVLGKQTRKPFPACETKRSSRVLEVIHSDVCGPVTPVGLDGVKHFVTFIDDWSHFTMVFLIESKDEVFDRFRNFEALVTAKFGKKISKLRCDNGGEYRSKQFERFCKEKGIEVNWTIPYTPEQNGVAERMNRTLVEKARAMMFDCGISKRFWGQAVQTAAYLVNRSPSTAIQSGVTPFELWESKKPNISKLRTFGCSVFVHIPKEHRKKMDSKAWKGIFIGYGHNGYRVWNTTSQRIVHARDVDFVEAEGGCSEEKLVRSSDVFQYSVPEKSGEERSEEVSDEESVDEFDSFRGDSDAEPEAEDTASGGRRDEPRQQRQRCPPKWHEDFEVEYAAYALNAMGYVDEVPNNLAEARKRSDWLKWKDAVEDELASLQKNNTWSLTKLPENRTPVTSKWVFRIKRGIDGKPDRYKARLVARGFSQRRGFDYSETYSPVAKLDTLRTVLAVANQENMVIHQMDVKTAFLNGELTEEIFMVQPEGYEAGENLVCRLQRCLYGLKQASRAWNERFHNFVKKQLKFERSKNDQCLYVWKSDKGTVLMVIYVDDIVVAGSSLKLVETVKRCLANEFEMTDGGEIRCFLGLRIDRDVKNGSMRISQKQYLQDMLKRFKMDDCKPISTPMENRLKLHHGEEKNRTTQPYRELIGCLTYAAMTTRPDLAASVNFFSQYQSCPTDLHWAYLKRILRYVKGSLDVGLVYQRNPNAVAVEVYCDADWANDVADRRSVSGAIFKVFGCTSAWITRKQQTVSLSSTEAELAALCVAACHEQWLVRLIRDLGYDPGEPVVFFEDNQSSMRIAEESKDFGRLKHVDVKFHYLRDLVRQKKIVLQYITTVDQQADMMTKSLPVLAFRKHCAGVGLANSSG